MSQSQIWGTGIAPADFALRQRATSEGDLRVTSDGDVRVAFIQPAQIIFTRVTSEGDVRVTSAGDVRVTLQGVAGPQYFITSNVTADGGEEFDFRWVSNPYQPAGQGGENLFSWAFIAMSWSMAALMRVTPIVDGMTDDLELPNGRLVRTVRSTFLLDQQDGSLQRKTQVFAIPLVRRLVTGAGAGVTRFYMRGERLQLAIESTGPLGVGELMLEGMAVDATAVRKAAYPGAVDSTP